MTHAFYVIGSYLLTAGICLGLTVWIYLDGRARQNELKALETQGIRRRSTASSQDTKA
ncbi:heme exporter protein D [Peteryoungia aggregata LMG 23059]|uniref:Heme exporter protein D n=1 Tax=Peteryoungia aggregata LMG 23059 TaxID=1368425 RepID=A0ABU0GA00_9HYPH|nr:heme exporter protein CcmD [Peteryoungia aggregata]MDQ0422172.1 heme exporter protein D [Peteryoungia aggregata LMG 23059]